MSSPQVRRRSASLVDAGALHSEAGMLAFRRAAGAGASLTFEPDALRALRAHSWPGNIRELRNVVTRIVLTASGSVGAETIRDHLGETSGGLFATTLLRSRSFEDLVSSLEREYLSQLLADMQGDLKRMAARLGITRRALYKRFERLGIRR
jgi:DNA-binding NtrC family response regulator